MNEKPHVLTVSLMSAVLLSGFATGACGAEFQPGSLNVSFDFNTFNGTGFAASPAAGQLDSDDWRATGMSDGDGTFSGTHTTGDFARGSSTGGVATGGVYGFDVSGAADIALGIQPIGTDFTPGTFELKIDNNSDQTLTSFSVAYQAYVFNDQDRANSFDFSYKVGTGGTEVDTSLDLTSPEASDVSPTWVATEFSDNFSVTIPNGESLILLWTGNDVSGSGSRDEFGVDDVLVTGIPEPSSLGLLVLGSIGLLLMRGMCRWRRRFA